MAVPVHVLCTPGHVHPDSESEAGSTVAMSECDAYTARITVDVRHGQSPLSDLALQRRMAEGNSPWIHIHSADTSSPGTAVDYGSLTQLHCRSRVKRQALRMGHVR